MRPGFSTPWDAPTIPPFPFAFRNVEVLTLAWRTREAAVARLLPPPLEPASDVVLAHIYRMNDVDWLGAYGESNLSVGCSLPGLHATTPCADCHKNGNYGAVSAMCVSCHRDDAQRVRSPDHSTLLECGNCHNPNAWVPATQYGQESICR